jgi:hypothetical protein
MEKQKKKKLTNEMRVKVPTVVSRGLVRYNVLIPQYSRTPSESSTPAAHSTF